jgi:protein-arginine kinase activator protein McsA
MCQICHKDNETVGTIKIRFKDRTMELPVCKDCKPIKMFYEMK